jgi:hypothetical protein
VPATAGRHFEARTLHLAVPSLDALSHALLSYSYSKYTIAISFLFFESSSSLYSQQPAKSGRSSCKKCKTKIAAGDLRIGTHVERDDHEMTSWNHLECFAVPRKLLQQGLTPEDFVRDLLKDGSTDASLLPARADEIVAALQAKGGAAKGGKKEDDKEGGGAGLVWLDSIKKSFETGSYGGEDDDVKPSASKKPKDDMSVLVPAYGEYHKQNGAKLKEMLAWNRQHVGGTKPMMLTRVLDGILRGRLARCPLCEGGRLKLSDDGMAVTCSGSYDEDRGTRMVCQYQGSSAEAPRWQPW